MSHDEREVHDEGRRVDPREVAREKADHFNRIGRHDLAEREARALLAADPDDADGHVQLALAMRGLGRADEAILALRDAIRLDPTDSVFARILLGEQYIDQGRHRDAEQVLLEALRLDPGEPEAYRLYGYLMWKTGRKDKAERLVREALRLDPDDAASHSLLGALRADREAAGRGLALEPDEEYSHASMGYACLSRGRPFAARRHLREALRLDPGDTDLEEAFLQADRVCRIVYLPMYYWSLGIAKLPGKQFAVWAGVMVAMFGATALGVPQGVIVPLLLAYLLLVVYTWVADPLTSLWIKLRPPR